MLCYCTRALLWSSECTFVMLIMWSFLLFAFVSYWLTEYAGPEMAVIRIWVPRITPLIATFSRGLHYRHRPSFCPIVVVRMFPQAGQSHTGQCRSVSHVVRVLQSGVILLLCETCHVASSGRCKWIFCSQHNEFLCSFHINLWWGGRFLSSYFASNGFRRNLLL